jgi:hypothetical protein
MAPMLQWICYVKEVFDLKTLSRKWLSATLVFLMLLGLLPAVPVGAAGTPVTITNPVGSTAASAMSVTQSPINVVATVSSDVISRVSEMYYEVDNITTGQGPGVIKTRPARQSGPYEITFDNVDLSEGLNKITVIIGDVNKIISQPVYVNYTPVSNITSLLFDGENFQNNKILPTSQKSSFLITGLAPNATSVMAQVKGASAPVYAQLRSGNFYFTVEDSNTPLSSSQTNFRLTPGDNDITFFANNATQTYQAARHVVYDNGKPFAYSVKLVDTNNTSVDLSNSTPYQPTTSGVPVKLTAELKFDTTSPTLSNAAVGQIVLNGNTGAPVDTITGGTAQNGTLTLNPGLSKPGTYLVYDYTLNNIPLPTNRFQTLDIDLTDENHAEQHTRFSFQYLPKDAAAITSVQRMVGSTGLDLVDSINGTNTITQVPLILNVQTANATGIQVTVGSQTFTSGSSSNITPLGGMKYKVDLSSVPDGFSTMTVTPLDSLGKLALDSVRTYQLSITSVPYVMMGNLYNGMVLKSITDLSTANGSGRIAGKIMNLDSSQYPSTQLYVNGSLVSGFGSAIQSDGSFDFLLPAGILVDGKNTFKINLIQNGAPVVSSSYEIFQFSQPAPAFTTISPISCSGVTTSSPFVMTAGDTYSTNEAYVMLTGGYNAQVQSMQVTVKRTGKDGKLATSSDAVSAVSTIPLGHATSGTVDAATACNNVYPIPTSSYYIQSASAGMDGTTTSYPGAFSTYYIKLEPQGQTVIEFKIANASGAAVTKTITISREPLPYQILSPVTVRNSKNQDQANINSNFADITISAEGADSVLFGKTAATQDAVNPNLFHFTAQNLKAGPNTLTFTVNRGIANTKGTLILFNTNTPIQGAQYMTTLSNRITAFNGNVRLTFPTNTLLKRNDPSAVDTNLTNGRQILFGIADNIDGRLDKMKHPVFSTDQVVTTNPDATSLVAVGKMMLMEQTGRFRPASSLYWMDAGTVSTVVNPTDSISLSNALNGRGRDPYDDAVFYNRTDTKSEVVPSNRGQLTLKYDPNIVTDSWRYVTVMHFEFGTDYRGIPSFHWKNMGGIVDVKANTITVPFDSFGYYQVMYMDRSFDDVISHPWARNDLDTVYSRGLMNNRQSMNVFQPYDPISRGEFVTLLVKIFDIPLNYDDNMTFNDVFKQDPFNDGLYDYRYIETAARAGIVRGNTGGAFLPADSITREQAASMIAKAARMTMSTDSAKSLAALQKMYTDANQIELYALPAVEAISKAKLVSGMQNVLTSGTKPTYRYAPKDTFSRAEAAVIALKVMKQQKKVP